MNSPQNKEICNGFLNYEYSDISNRRYQRSTLNYRRLFKKEIEMISLMQSTALDGIRVHNGHIKRLTDEEVNSLVLEICGTNVATTYISTPIDPRVSLGIKLPFLVMIVKNMKRYFSFEITILDDKDVKRRFRISNYQSTTRIGIFCTSMPICLTGGWNQIQFNLADFTRRAYGSNYIETIRMQIHANIRIRRVYFCDRIYSDMEKPADFRLVIPVKGVPKQEVGQAPAPSPEPDIPETPLEEKGPEELPEETVLEEPQEVAEHHEEGGDEAEAHAHPEEAPAEAPAEAAPEEAPPAEEPPAEAAPAEEGAPPAEVQESPPEAPPAVEAPAEAPPEEAAPPPE